MEVPVGQLVGLALLGLGGLGVAWLLAEASVGIAVVWPLRRRCVRCDVPHTHRFSAECEMAWSWSWTEPYL